MDVSAGSITFRVECAPVTELDLRPLALVTGASRGIGAAVARALAPGHDLLLGGRDTEALQALAAELPGARPWPVELTDTAALAEAAGGVERLDVLVHSAGMSALGTIAETPVATWRRQFEVNVVAVAELTRLLLPALRAARGRVVLLNAGVGLQRPARMGVVRGEQVRPAGVRRRSAGRGGAERPAGHLGAPRAGRHRDAAQRRRPGGRRVPSRRRYLRPESVAGAVLLAVTAPDDAALTELVLRPAPR